MSHRKSAEEKKIAGTFRRDREPPPDLSAPLQKLPRPPERLSKAGRAAWRRTGQACIELGSLRHSDLDQLELLSAALGLAQECEQRINAEGLTVTSDTGVTKAHPLAPVMQAARRDAHRALQILGLSPIGRIRTGSKKPAQLAPMSSFNRPTLVSPVFDDAGRPMTLREFLEADGKGPPAK
jgi:P27 family predicted phage terminase small subunit